MRNRRKEAGHRPGQRTDLLLSYVPQKPRVRMLDLPQYKEKRVAPAGVPQLCPVTQAEFMAMVSHPELGTVPVYGSPGVARTTPMLHSEASGRSVLTTVAYDFTSGSWQRDISIPLCKLRAARLLSLVQRALDHHRQNKVSAEFRLEQCEDLNAIAATAEST